MKYLITLLFLTKLLNASMLLGANSYCIEDFYIKAGSFYYLRSDNSTWYSTTTDTYTATVRPNYIYDSATNQCNPNMSYILGMQETEYNFLLGLVGLIFGAVFMFFTTQIFIAVGGKKMILIEITDISIINYFASIFINLTVVIAPLFGALALFRH